MSEHFKITRHEHGIFISCDPEAVHDLAATLDHLYELTRLMRSHAEAIAAQRRIVQKRAAAQAKIACDEMSREVYIEYAKQLDHGKNEKAALLEIRAAFRLKAVDARGYVKDGKKLMLD